MENNDKNKNQPNLKVGINNPKARKLKETPSSKHLKHRYDIQRLKRELSHRPDILKFVLYIQFCLKHKTDLLKKVKTELKALKKSLKVKRKCAATQTDDNHDSINKIDTSVNNGNVLWDTSKDNTELSLADQVKQAAESAMTQSGMVYEETSGMYYDYNTGYYYNSVTGLYYHSSTGCYYYYDREQNTFSYHSHADPKEFPSLEDGDLEKRLKSKGKHKKKRKTVENNESNPVNDESVQSKKLKNENDGTVDCDKTDSTDKNKKESTDNTDSTTDNCKVDNVENSNSEIILNDEENKNAMSEGEYTGPDSSEYDSDSSFESIIASHPPCMRIIVNETSAENIKIGSLFMLTKDGGTLGREGSRHSIIIPEENISRHHLTFTYDEEKHSYFVKDMGSRNGTILNGKKISILKKESDLVEIVHGSTIQLGNSKLLCHIHKGNATCGHCEPGLLIKDTPPKIVQRVKTTNMKTLHKKELRRLKEKYKVKPNVDTSEGTLLPEGYEDKAQLRREKVGSTHSSVKTVQASLDTNIPSANKGFKMLQKMGWSEGDGLGKNTQGIVEPVAVVSNEGTAGLGSANPVWTNPASTWKKVSWMATKQRFDKATTSTHFDPEVSDEEETQEKQEK